LDILETIFLGLVQGATEFLPVSSSGHLMLVQNLNGVIAEEDLFLDVMLHLGTLAAVFIFCWQEVKMLFRALPNLFRRELSVQQEEERTLFWALLVASIPTAIIGLVIKKTMVGLFSNWYFLGATFLATTLFLVASHFIKEGNRKIALLTGLITGIAQGLAVLPGISRAGATIVTAQAMGLERKKAARFAFLLAVPAIIGASLLQVVQDFSMISVNAHFIIPVICGMIVAAIVGYFSLVLLTKIIEKAKLSWFAVYTFSVSVFCFAWAVFA
jgi:undecaprenyl-diphosphatase